MYDKIEKIAVDMFFSALRSAGPEDSLFRILMNVDLDGSIKPLLVVGHAHPLQQDGHVIVVLNPDMSLISRINPGCAYGKFGLKEMVQGKCDLMLDLWVAAYNGLAVGCTNRYKSRKPCSERFSLLNIKMTGSLNRP